MLMMLQFFWTLSKTKCKLLLISLSCLDEHLDFTSISVNVLYIQLVVTTLIWLRSCRGSGALSMIFHVPILAYHCTHANWEELTFSHWLTRLLIVYLPGRANLSTELAVWSWSTRSYRPFQSTSLRFLIWRNGLWKRSTRSDALFCGMALQMQRVLNVWWPGTK